MGYRVDYNLLDDMYEELVSRTETWSKELDVVKTAINRLCTSQNMSGVSAEAVKNYLTMIHLPMVETLISLVNLHKTNFVLYKDSYVQCIDSGLNAVIDENELAGITQELNRMQNSAVAVDEETRAILRQIGDIFSTSFHSVADVGDAIAEARDLCTTLSENVNSLESMFMQSAFSNTGPTIDILNSSILTCLQKNRDFKENFDPNDAGNLIISRRLQMLNSILLQDVNGKAAAVEAAIANHEARQEMEKRMEFAKWETLIVSAAVIAISAVVLAVIPVSGPLVVATVSGISGALMSGNKKMMDLYVVDGDINAEDWKKIGGAAAKGGISGFITGYIGGVSSHVMSGMVKGSGVVGHVVIGATTEVTTGVIQRGTTELIDQISDGEKGINWNEVKDEAFDDGEMKKDAVLGGVGGYMEGHKVDYSEGMNSDYENQTIDDMYKNNEIDEWSDMDADTYGDGYSGYSDSERAVMDNMYDKGEMDVDIPDDKTFEDTVRDYTFKEKENQRDLSMDSILSPDEFSHAGYETADRLSGYRDIFDRLNGQVHDRMTQSNDKTLYDILKENGL